jgi:type II secretory pathway pseudopilin PulG
MTILAGLLLPALTKAREKAKVAKCISTIASLQTALSMYQVDYGMYPQSAISQAQPDQHNGNSHHTDFNGAPNNFVAAITARTLGGPYIEFKGSDLIEKSGEPNARKYVLKDPWGQAYIYVCQKWYDVPNNKLENASQNAGPYHPDASHPAKNSNTYNIYSLGPDKKTHNNDDYSGSTDDWDKYALYDTVDDGHWKGTADSNDGEYDDINSWDGSRSF